MSHKQPLLLKEPAVGAAVLSHLRSLAIVRFTVHAVLILFFFTKLDIPPVAMMFSKLMSAQSLKALRAVCQRINQIN
jgi:hypothetical protein